jgi:hypothetical protein
MVTQCQEHVEYSFLVVVVVFARLGRFRHLIVPTVHAGPARSSSFGVRLQQVAEKNVLLRCQHDFTPGSPPPNTSCHPLGTQDGRFLPWDLGFREHRETGAPL